MSLAVYMDSMQDMKVSLKMDVLGKIAFEMKPTSSFHASSLFPPSLRGTILHFQSASDGAGGLYLDVWISGASGAHQVVSEDTERQNYMTAVPATQTTMTESIPELLSSSFLFPTHDYRPASQAADLDLLSMLSGYSSSGIANQSIDMAGIFSSENNLRPVIRQSFPTSLLPAPTSHSESSGLEFMSDEWNKDEPPLASSFVAEESTSVSPSTDPPVAATFLSVSSPTDNSRSPQSSTPKSPSSPEGHCSNSDASPRPYPCLHPGCNRWFTRSYTRTVHMRTHTRLKNCEVARFACGVAGCTNRFSRKHDRLRHEVTQHGKSSEWRCDICRLHFSSAPRLERHNRGKHRDSAMNE